MKLFLGVDGGQSGTEALIGDDAGRVLGRGESGPCNHARAGEGRAKLLRAVRGSLEAACHNAQLDAAGIEFESACFGMSGGPEDKADILAEALRAKRLLVTHDAAIALAGATTSGAGVIVVAGTGSMAYGRNERGKSARAGGWGYVFGDEGGAFDIVRRAIRAALQMEEGWGPGTTLRDTLLQATGARDANAALHLFYTDEWPRARVAALAHLVDAAAEGGDEPAIHILQGAAEALSRINSAVYAQLWPDGGAVEMAFVGGAFRSRLLLERFSAATVRETGCQPRPPLRGPAEGALLEAYRAAGMDVSLE